MVRSMKRIGFSYAEIYDTLTGTGLSGGEVQLLLDRIETDFEDAKMESRDSRLGEEVEEVFEKKLKSFQIEVESNLRTLRQKIESLSTDLEILAERITELQKICAELSKKKNKKNVQS